MKSRDEKNEQNKTLDQNKKFQNYKDYKRRKGKVGGPKSILV
jgi:hypothetical protein